MRLPLWFSHQRNCITIAWDWWAPNSSWHLPSLGPWQQGSCIHGKKDYLLCVCTKVTCIQDLSPLELRAASSNSAQSPHICQRVLWDCDLHQIANSFHLVDQLHSGGKSRVLCGDGAWSPVWEGAARSNLPSVGDGAVECAGRVFLPFCHCCKLTPSVSTHSPKGAQCTAPRPRGKCVSLPGVYQLFNS